MMKDGGTAALKEGFACVLAEPLAALGKTRSVIWIKEYRITGQGGIKMKGVATSPLSLDGFANMQSLFAGILTTQPLQLQTERQLRPNNCRIRPLYATGGT